MTSALCTFEGPVSQIRIVGAGRAVILATDVFEHGNTTAVEFVGALQNATITTVDEQLNPINPNPECHPFDATYTANDRIRVVVTTGGDPGLFLGKLPSGRDCHDGCPVEWSGAKQLYIERKNDIREQLAGPLPEGDPETCATGDGGTGPRAGVEMVVLSASKGSFLTCGDQKKTIEGDWVFRSGPSRSLTVDRIAVRGSVLEAHLTSELPPKPSKAEFSWQYVAGGFSGALVMLGLFVLAYRARRNAVRIKNATEDKPPPHLPSTSMLDVLLYVDDKGVSAKANLGSTWSKAHSLGENGSLEKLAIFAEAVNKRVQYRRKVDDDVLEQAHALHRALFDGDLLELFLRACSAAHPLLVRFVIDDPRLQGVPWEALCRPDTSVDFLGSRTDVFVVRGASSTDVIQPRDLPSPLRILLIAPQNEPTDDFVKQPLEIGGAEVEFFAGSSVTWKRLCTRLQTGLPPDVIHFLGHGGMEGDHPTLRLADDEEGKEVWVKAESFALQVQACFAGALPLIVLETCEGAKAGVFGSAAEYLVRKGVDTVVSFLWPIRADVSQETLKGFYTALMKGNQTRGDVVASACAIRRTLLEETAAGFALVVHVRGNVRQ